MRPALWRSGRPSLGLVLSLVLATVLALPLAGVFASGVYDDQLVRRTEAELLAQSVALAASIAREAAASVPTDAALGGPIAAGRAIDLDADLGPARPPRPDALSPKTPADPAFQALGARVAPDLAATQAVTLAGFRLLDPSGTVIAGREEVGQSLAHVDEVAEALRGRTAVALRRRVSKHPYPPAGSLSRGRPYRLFLAVPIVVRHRVAGVLYASRTPVDILGSLYGQREALGLAAAAVVLAAVLAGLVLHRAISLPVRELVSLTRAIGAGDRTAVASHRHHGTVEFAVLAGSFREMATRLTNRSDAVASFAAHVSHELKSPLTAIRGTAELLRDDDGAPMEAGDRSRFLDHLLADTERLGALLSRLAEMARAEAEPTGGSATLPPALNLLRGRFPALTIAADGDVDAGLGVSADSLVVLLSHLADNAGRHGATTLRVSARRAGRCIRIEVHDDGTGISPGNRARVFETFFTTRRDDGGTGMGLSIVRALVGAHGGSVELLDTRRGAGFALTVPALPGPPLGPPRADVARRRRRAALAATSAVLLAGLALRGVGPGLGLPFASTKYGGSILWGAMVYGVLATLMPTAPRARLTAIALAAAVTVEAFRLFHTPTLDAFRLTTAGALLLGRVFSGWNVAAYAVGIATAWRVDRSATAWGGPGRAGAGNRR